MNVYTHAAQIIDKLQNRRGTIKGLILGDPKVKDKKKMYALVCETLKYKAVLNEIIEATDILRAEKNLSRPLALLLIHDLLFGKRGIPLPSHAPLKKCVHRHQTRLKAELAKIKVKRGVSKNTDLVNDKAQQAHMIPRFVRVNILKTTVEKIITALDTFTLVDTPDDLRQLKPGTFCRDKHLNDLLVFPPKTDFHDHPLYVAGDMILQDKASCFPAHVLHPPKDSHVIDACAAPGNKTSHLSALMHNTGRIWAFDLDARRLELLKRLTGRSGCQNIAPVHGSFVEVDPNDPTYSKVEYILLDPSCSGSGIVSRLDHLVDNEEQEQSEESELRLQQLATFQVSVIQHAMKFPNVKRIVYSTCSIHAEENEYVVRTVLADTSEFVLATRDSVLPTWQHRGLPEALDGNTDLADTLVRANPTEDLTNGFFVACFVRKDAHPSNVASSGSRKKKKQKKGHAVANASS